MDAAGEGYLAWARVTPSGRSVVYTHYGNPIVIGAMDLETGERTVLSEGIMPKPTAEGYIVFTSIGGEILAAPFEEGPMRLTGPAVPLVEGVFVSGDATPRIQQQPGGGQQGQQAGEQRRAPHPVGGKGQRRPHQHGD